MSNQPDVLYDRISRRLAERFPDLSFSAHKDEGGNWFLKAPSPGRPDGQLNIVVSEDEIIVGFDIAHGHNKITERRDAEQVIADSLEQVNQIVSENVYVVVTEKNGRPYRFGLRSINHTPKIEEDERIRYTRSWSGTYDSSAES